MIMLRLGTLVVAKMRITRTGELLLRVQSANKSTVMIFKNKSLPIARCADEYGYTEVTSDCTYRIMLDRSLGNGPISEIWATCVRDLMSLPIG
jgi:hypothetical protein